MMLEVLFFEVNQPNVSQRENQIGPDFAKLQFLIDKINQSTNFAKCQIAQIK